MDWINNFLIPLITMILLGFLILFISWCCFKAIKIVWSRWFIHFLKYRILGKGIDKALIDELNNMSSEDIKKNLLLNGFSLIEANEVLYLKNWGGKQNVRKTKKHDR